MKGIYIAIIIFIALIIIAGIFLKRIADSISFDYEFKQFDFSQLLKGKIGITLDLLILNCSKYNIILGRVYLSLYYKDKLIAKTRKPIPQSQLKPGKETRIKGFSLDILLDKDSWEITSKYVKREKIDFKIKMKLDLYGITVGLPKIPFTFNPVDASTDKPSKKVC